MLRRESGLHALYHSDPERADWQVFGRRSDPVSRRGFIAGASRVAALLGAEVVFARCMPAGLIPAALADSEQPFQLQGKDPALKVLNDRPINIEPPAHMLDDAVTPSTNLFVRNNGIPPGDVKLNDWKLRIDGESVREPLEFSLEELKSRFSWQTLQLVIECGGNGRSEFRPAASGNQWTTGAVGCPAWTGIRLRDVLIAAGVEDSAIYVGYYGADSHLSGDPSKSPISRGIPIAKAMEAETLIAFAMNGQDLPPLHGYPLRLVVGGWPASVSGKWLKRLVVRDRVHDGAKMGGQSYRVPCEPVMPGVEVRGSDMCIIESMPVKSLITFPRSGLDHSLGETLVLRGHAWAGDSMVESVEISIDFGQTWNNARLEEPVNRLAWQHFRAAVEFPKRGYYEIWAKARDVEGRSQPMLVPGWNPRGYLNNACHRVAVRVV